MPAPLVYSPSFAFLFLQLYCLNWSNLYICCGTHLYPWWMPNNWWLLQVMKYGHNPKVNGTSTIANDRIMESPNLQNMDANSHSAPSRIRFIHVQRHTACHMKAQEQITNLGSKYLRPKIQLHKTPELSTSSGWVQSRTNHYPQSIFWSSWINHD